MRCIFHPILPYFVLNKLQEVHNSQETNGFLYSDFCIQDASIYLW